MAQTNNAKLQDEVSNLKTDMSKVGALVERLGPTIDKLTEVSTNISQLLAVHETKITSQDIVLKQTVDLVEKRRIETEEKIQLVHDRVSDLDTKFASKLDKQHQELMAELKQMQSNSAVQHQEMSQTLGARISKLEKWMWGLIGAGIVVSVIFQKVIIPLMITN
jgi:chromosome segregation ATPase